MGQSPGRPGAIALARAGWPALETLNLGKCGLGARGVAALAGSPGFPVLRSLRLDNNPAGGAGLAHAGGCRSWLRCTWGRGRSRGARRPA
ncbi:MAG: hypothetical protein K2W96_01585 [Gemmataceae bacterium]|nr:hypothetical protein [Gemmataceae bacterium]